MEDKSIYGAIIIALVIGVVIVITSLVVARPEPERFTELYFNQHRGLDKYSYDGYHGFSFTIHNMEGEDREYAYEIKVNDRVVKEDVVSVNDGGETILFESVQLSTPFSKAKISVNLPEEDQEIHFWVKYTNKAWMEYDGREDGAMNCLPVNDVREGDFIIVKMRGSYAEGWPIMEIWVNGQKYKEIEIDGEMEEYIVYGPIEGDAIIDLAFVNNHGIKEDDMWIWDRNIYVEYVRTLDHYLDYVYDKDEWDCEDIREGDMKWNGALRFRVRTE